MTSQIIMIGICVLVLLILALWYFYVAYIKIPIRIRRLKCNAPLNKGAIENNMKIITLAKKKFVKYLGGALALAVVQFLQSYLGLSSIR